MAVIKTDGGYNALPIAYKRGNPIPLDTTAVWYNYEEMATYAAEGVTAYVGQILGLVDETNKTAKAYIILNTQGDLQEVGSAILVDETTITLSDEGVLSLKDFGVKYYKYIAETTDEETGEIISAHYIKQIVNEDNPWSAGLEPKVVSEDGKWVIGWYEPNPTTIEGINSQVSTIQSTVNDLANEVSDLNTAVGVPANAETGTAASGIFAELDKKANIVDLYTKGEIDNAIATAVANIDHLKRVKVNSIDDIDVDALDAENYIYMVPNGLTENDDKYNEYMVIDGVLEKVGDWEVSLDNYITEEELNTKLSDYSTTKQVEDKIAVVETGIASTLDNYATKNELTQGLSDKVTNTTLTNTLKDYATTSSVTTIVNNAVQDKVTNAVFENALAGKVDAVEGYGLISDEDLDKLDKIPITAEENVIKTVDETEFTLTQKHLTLNSINASKIVIIEDENSTNLVNKLNTLNTRLTNLSGQVDNNTANITLNLEKINANITNIGNLSTSLEAIDTRIQNIEKDYVKLTVYQSKIAELEDRLLWHEMEI